MVGKYNKKVPGLGSTEWVVCVLPDCERHLGIKRDTIERHLLGHLKRHPPSHRNVNRVKFQFPKKKEPWIVYFLVVGNCVDALDAAPIVESGRGKSWLALVEEHFNVFGMAWRLRPPLQTEEALISGGVAAIEHFKESVDHFINSIPALTGFKSQITTAGNEIDNYYRSRHHGSYIDARNHLESAVYCLHQLLYRIGEELRLIPTGAKPKKRRRN